MIFIKLFMTNKYFHHRRIYIYDFTFLFKIYTVSPLLITTDSLENLTLSLTLKGFIVIFCYFYCHDHIILMSWYIYIYIFLYLYMIKIEYYHIYVKTSAYPTRYQSNVSLVIHGWNTSYFHNYNKYQHNNVNL